MKKFVVILIVCMILFMGCRFQQYTHELVEKGQHSVDNVFRFAVVDLNGDIEDEFIILQEKDGEYSEITVRGADFEIYSQLNLMADINQISYYDVDDDGEQEIFISGVNSEREIFIYQVNYEWKKKLLRNEKPIFQTIRRDNLPAEKRCYSRFGVKGMGDVDGVGKDELFLIGAAGFSCYPRGLWIVDAETGEEKWHFEMACNYRTINYSDLDMDGEHEIIITTQALKNHQNVINQTDDNHSYLLILSKDGELLYKEELARGFSKIDCFLEDVDDDGREEIITVKTTWGKQHERNGIFIYKWENSRLTLIKERQFERPFARKGGVIFADIDNNGKSEVFLVTDEHELLVFNNDLGIVGKYDETALRNIFKVIDLNGDGNKEIIAVTHDGYIMILDNQLRCRMLYTERNISEAKLVLYNPGFGENKQLVCFEGGNFQFYEYGAKGITSLYYLKILLSVILFAVIIFFVVSYLRMMLLLKVYYNILERVESAILIINGRNKILYSNSQMEELCGTGKLRNKKLGNISKTAKLLGSELEKYKVSGNVEYHNNLKEPVNKRFLEIRIRRFKEKAGLYIIRVSDRTDILQMQEKVDWAETARGLSHGIRKHLNNILLATEQIAVSEDKKVKTLSPIIMEEINNLKYFVQSFQRFTELKKLQLQVMDTNEFIKDYLDNLVPDFPATIRFVSEIEYDLPWIEIDRVRFIEVFNNLINNALEAIEGEGKIILRAYRWEDTKKKGKVCFEISDTGCGIPEEVIDNIFIPYFTTKESGTGIGLSLAKKMMNEFGGRIEVESRIEVGTTIRLIIPVSEKGRK